MAGKQKKYRDFFLLYVCPYQRSARLSWESRDRDLNFWNHGLIVKTETETFSLVVSISRLRPRHFWFSLKYKLTWQTRLNSWKTNKNKYRRHYSRWLKLRDLDLSISGLSRPRLFETIECQVVGTEKFECCGDWDWPRLIKSCRDRDFS